MTEKAHGLAGQEQKRIAALFRKHLEEHHNITTEQEFDAPSVVEHLEGEHTLLPVSIFSNRKLSALESIVKYLRENEQLSNSKAAQLLGRSPAAAWITYRNATRKLAKRLLVESSDRFIPTTAIASGQFSVLESISLYLHDNYRLSYKAVGRLLKRDERTIWTVCHRARRKMGR